MGDMGDLFRDLEADKKLRREERLRHARASDLPGWTQHTQWHWSRLLGGQKLNWWPSTGKWSWGMKGIKPAMFFGRQEDLLNFIQKREE
jgi:hypothetical protein